MSVIRSDQFPDKLFAPPKRTDLMADGANPIFDKEMRSELFGQGTLMLRLVIQLSMLLALPLMAVCLYIKASWAAWYACYVVLFNVLVGDRTGKSITYRVGLDVTAVGSQDRGARSLGKAALGVAIAAAVLALGALFVGLYLWLRPPPR